MLPFSTISDSLPRIVAFGTLVLGLLFGIQAAELPLPRSINESTSDDPFPVRRVLLSSDQLAKELATAKEGAWTQLPLKEFEDRLRRATQGRQNPAPVATLTESRYHARLLSESTTENGLEGTGEWKIERTGSGPVVLPIPTMQLALRSARWSDNRSALIGYLEAAQPNRLCLFLEKETDRSLALAWSARAISTLGEFHFDLGIPACARTEFDLELPKGWVASCSQPEALVTATDNPQHPNRRNWRILAGGIKHLELTVRPPILSSQLPILKTTLVTTRQQVFPLETRTITGIDFEALQYSASELVLEHDPGFIPSEVAASNLEDWSQETSPTGNRSLRLRFHEPIRRGQITVRGSVPRSLGVSMTAWTGLALGTRFAGGQLNPLGPNPRWVSPWIELANAIPGPEKLEIQLPGDYQMTDWNPGAFRLLKREVGTDQGQTFFLESIKYPGSPSLRPQGRTRWLGTEYSVVQHDRWTIGSENSRFVSKFQIAVERGELGTLPLQLPTGWEFTRASMMGLDNALAWRNAGNGVVHVDFVRGVPSGQTVEVDIELRVSGTAAVQFDSVDYPIPNLNPMGVARRRGDLTIEVNPPWHALAFETATLREDAGPNFDNRLPSAYPYVGQPPAGRIRLRANRSRLLVRSETTVTIADPTPIITARFQLQAKDPVARTLDFWSSAAIAPLARWQIEEGDNAVLSARRMPYPPQLLMASLGSSTALEAVTRFASPRSGDWWQITLAKAVQGKITLEVVAPIAFTPSSIERVRGFASVVGAAAGMSIPRPEAGAEIPLLQLLGAETQQARVRVKPQPGSILHWTSQGLTSEPTLLGMGPSFRHGTEPIHLTIFQSTKAETASVAGLRQVVLDTTVQSTATRDCTFRFQFRQAGRSQLPITLPLLSSIQEVTIDGIPVTLDDLFLADLPPNQISVPFLGDGGWHSVTLRYRLPPQSVFLQGRIESPLPSLPIPIEAARRIWHLAPGLAPMNPAGLISWPGNPDLSSGLPWAMSTESIDGTVGFRSAPAQPQASNRTPNVARTWRQLLLRYASDGNPWVLDLQALQRCHLLASTEVTTTTNLPALLESHGLVLVNTPTGNILTTLPIESIWKAESSDGHSLPRSVLEAVRVALATGRDPSGRFVSVAEWAATTQADGEPIFTDAVGWTTWESVDTADSLQVVYPDRLRLLGWCVGAVFPVLLLSCTGRRSFVGIAITGGWLAGWGLLLRLLAEPLKGIAFGPVLGGLLAAILVGRTFQKLERFHSGSRTELIRPSSGSTRSASRFRAISALICLVALPVQAAPTDPITVYLLPGTAKNNEIDRVLVPTGFLTRLNRATDPKTPILVTSIARAEYRGKSSGKALAEFEVRFFVQAFSENAELTIPLNGARLREALVDGAAAFPNTDLQDRLKIGLKQPGEHRIDLKFAVPISSNGSERSIQFSIPEVLQSELRFTGMGEVESLQALTWQGAQQTLDAGKTVVVDLGNSRSVHLRWRTLNGTPTTAQPRVETATVWELQPMSAALRTVLEYRLGQESISRFRLAIPQELEVARIEVIPETPPAIKLPGWVRDWNISPQSESPSYRTLQVDLQVPLTGNVRLMVDLIARQPATVSPTLRTVMALEAIETSASIALRLSGLELQGNPQLVGLVDLPQPAFLEGIGKWLNPAKTAVPLISAYRKVGIAEPLLRPSLRAVPALVSASVEASWWLNPWRPELRAELRLVAGNQPLAMVEWELPTEVTVFDVRGLNLDRWSRAGNRFQAWLRQPTREVVLWVDAALPARITPPEALSLELPTLRILGISTQETTLRLRSPTTVCPTLERAETLGKSLEPHQPTEQAIRLSRPTEPVRVTLRLPDPKATFTRLDNIVVQPGVLQITSYHDCRIRRDRPHRLTVGIDCPSGATASIELPNSCRVIDAVRSTETQQWTVEVLPHEQDVITIITMVKQPLTQPSIVPLPKIRLGNGSDKSSGSFVRVGWDDPRIQLVSRSQGRLIPEPDPTTVRRLGHGSKVWELSSEAGEFSILASPLPIPERRPIRMLLADLETSRVGNRWKYRGIFEVLQQEDAEVEMQFDSDVVIDDLLLEGRRFPQLPRNGSGLDFPLHSQSGIRRIEVVWSNPKPLWELPSVLVKGRTMPIERVVWTMYVPPGLQARGLPESSAIAQELERAEAQLRGMEAVLDESMSDDERKRLSSGILFRLRLATARLAETGSSMTEAEGRAFADRIAILRERTTSLVKGPTPPDRSTATRLQVDPLWSRANDFYLGKPIRFTGTGSDLPLPITLEDQPLRKADPPWTTLISLLACVGIWLLLAGLGRVTWPEQLAILGLLSTLAFSRPDGLGFLAICLIGIALRLASVVQRVLKKRASAPPPSRISMPTVQLQ